MDYRENVQSDDSIAVDYEIDRNVIDNKTYSDADIHPFKDMNLFVIQLESVQNFVIDLKYKDDYLMPYTQVLLNDPNTFYFTNAHTSVGLGNTSDAEFAFNTGIYPLGDNTIAWDAYDDLFDINSIPKLFNANYNCYSYNPTIESFYAHKYIHEKLYCFDKFSGFETFEKTYSYATNQSLYLGEKWVSDTSILSLCTLDASKSLKQGKNFYIFTETITPHYPFLDLSDKYDNYTNLIFDQLDSKFNNYLSQIHQNDKIIYDAIIHATEILPNTLFILYGDHGNTLSIDSYEKLFGVKLTDLEYRKLLLEVPFIFYDPSGQLLQYCLDTGVDLDKMTNKVCSQVDLFKTICCLYGLEANSYGINLFSNEPSFAIDPKNLDIITDSFIYSLKNNDYEVFSEIDYNRMIDIIVRIKKFKLMSDRHLAYIIGR